jgi:hypothetical protein
MSVEAVFGILVGLAIVNFVMMLCECVGNNTKLDAILAELRKGKP